MTIDLFWIDFFLKERLFGFGILSIKNDDWFNRSLLSIYWNDGELLIDLLYFRVVTTFWFWLLFHKEE